MFNTKAPESLLSQYEVPVKTSKMSTELRLFLLMPPLVNVLKLTLTPQVVLNLFVPDWL